MFGYVHPSKARLTQDDIELYKSAYCGLCHSLGKQYGYIGRFTLNYDFTFLAMLSAKETICRKKNCIRHPFKRQECVCNSDSFDKVAGISMILSYWQIKDSVNDAYFLEKLKYYPIICILHSKYLKARRVFPEFDLLTRDYLNQLAKLEAQKCTSIDQVADCFASLLSEASMLFEDLKEQRIMRQLLYHLGRWIYIVDAVDDYEKDCKNNNFNPISFRYQFNEEKLSDTIKSEIKITLDASIRYIASCFELLEPNRYHSLLENIIYEGLYLVENSVFNGSYHKAINKAQEYGE